MLVLSRCTDEEVVIKTPEGREIVIAVMEIRTDTISGKKKVRLGFNADKDFQIDRLEVAIAKQTGITTKQAADQALDEARRRRVQERLAKIPIPELGASQ